jgi:hypothetical protein
MKYTKLLSLTIPLLLISLQSVACDQDYKIPQQFLANDYERITNLYGGITKIQQAAIDEELKKNETRKQLEKPRYTVTFTNNGKPGPDGFKVFGYTEQDVLNADGDPRGNACTDLHNHEDLSNRWCHGIITRLVQKGLEEAKIDPITSSIAGCLVFVPKEFLIDMKPTYGDLVCVSPDVKLYQDKNKTTKAVVNVTVYGDGHTSLNVNIDF